MPRFVKLTASTCATPTCQPGVFRPGEAHVSLEFVRFMRDLVAGRAHAEPAHRQEIEDYLQMCDLAIEDIHRRSVDLRIAEAVR